MVYHREGRPAQRSRGESTRRQGRRFTWRELTHLQRSPMDRSALRWITLPASRERGLGKERKILFFCVSPSLWFTIDRVHRLIKNDNLLSFPIRKFLIGEYRFRDHSIYAKRFIDYLRNLKINPGTGD
jgi:hypothetical protein